MENRVIKFSLIVFCVSVIVVSCEHLEYGNIVEKEYHPAWTQVMFIPIIISDGKTTSTMMIPYFVWHNESWSIDVEGKGTKGSIMTETFYVDKLAYDTSKIGDFICVKGLCDEDTATHKIRQ